MSVLVDMSMSLDGFLAGPNDDVDRLHDWLFNGDRRHTDRSASVLPGREETRVVEAPGVTHLRFRVAKQGS